MVVLTCSTASQGQNILEQGTCTAVSVYKGQITSYSFESTCVFYAQPIFLILPDKMVVLYKVRSHIIELDQKACGTTMLSAML